MDTTVLLIDDHVVMRRGLRLLLEEEQGMCVVGEAGNGQEAVDLAEKLSPDVVVMDITMPGLNGVEATRRIISAHPQTKVVALSIHAGKRFVQDMLQAGAAGYVLKESTSEDLVEGIRAVVRGEVYLSASITGVVVSQYMRALSGQLAPASDAELTPSERETLRLITEGNSAKQIASVLRVSLKTIEATRRRIMRKLGVNSVAELAEVARKADLVEEAAADTPAGGKTSYPIVATKLHRPAMASDILPRARLLDKLNEGRQHPLTLISAPAGYGKSTLASCWVAACDCPNVWVSLDKDDGDPRVFLSYFLAAIRTAFPAAGQKTQALLDAAELPPVSVLARYLLNDLDEIDDPFILVLDDYDHIHERAVHDLLAGLLAHPSQTMHLALLTRRDPPLPISTLRARGQVTEIRVADLRFTAAEIAAFMAQMVKIPVDDATAAILGEKTEGWVTGLRLAALFLRDRKDLDQMVRNLRGSFRYIADYLIAEVISGQPPAITSYMIEASLFDRFCAPLCEAVHAQAAEGAQGGGEIEAQEFIKWMEKANIFVVPLDEQHHWFRYHRLFRQLLQGQLKQLLTHEEIAAMHTRADAWFAQHGLADEGIEPRSLQGELSAGQLLTRRELELLPLLAEGLSNKDIARELHIATETIKTHLHSIYQKLGVAGRGIALRKARELGLLPGD